jgi:hypothetical protein
MVIEVNYIASPLSGRFIKPRGEWGYVQVLVVDYTSQAIYHTTVPRKSVCCVANNTGHYYSFLFLPFFV